MLAFALLCSWLRLAKDRRLPRSRPSKSLIQRRAYRPCVDQLEDRLPPGDLLNLLGLSLGAGMSAGLNAIADGAVNSGGSDSAAGTRTGSGPESEESGGSSTRSESSSESGGGNRMGGSLISPPTGSSGSPTVGGDTPSQSPSVPPPPTAPDPAAIVPILTAPPPASPGPNPNDAALAAFLGSGKPGRGRPKRKPPARPRGKPHRKPRGKPRPTRPPMATTNLTVVQPPAATPPAAPAAVTPAPAPTHDQFDLGSLENFDATQTWHDDNATYGPDEFPYDTIDPTDPPVRPTEIILPDTTVEGMPIRPYNPSAQPRPTPTNVDYGPTVLGSQALRMAASTYSLPPAQREPETLALLNRMLVFDAANRVHVNVRAESASQVPGLRQALEENLSMSVTGETPEQALVTGWMAPERLNEVVSQPGYAAATPVWAPIVRTNGTATAGGAVLADELRDGSGITVGVISDSVGQRDNGRDGNPDRGLTESQRTGALPAVSVLADGPATGTDAGRAMLEVVHDVAPGANLVFHTGTGGPQAMARGITTLAEQAQVIVDDIGYPNEPFFNEGVVARAVSRAVAVHQAVYVTAAGNSGDHAWEGAVTPTPATVGGESQTLLGAAGGVLHPFHLAPGGTLNLVLQWDSAFLEGGSQLAPFQVQNDVEILVTDVTGGRVLFRWDDVNASTDEALERLVFHNGGGYGTSEFALAFRLVSGPAPTYLKFIRLDNEARFATEGAGTIWGHAGSSQALTVGAALPSAPDRPAPYSSVGGVQFFFASDGARLGSPYVLQNKPNVLGGDQVAVAHAPAGGLGLAGTGAAAAQAAGAAALVRGDTNNSPQVIGGELADSPPPGTLGNGFTPRLVLPTASGLALGIQATGPRLGILQVGPVVNASVAPLNQSEVAIAVDPTQPNRLFAGSNEVDILTGMAATFSTNNGASWSYRVMANGSDGIPEGFSDPVLAWDDFGNLFYCYIDSLDSSINQVVMSTDGGSSFRLVQSVSTGSGSTLDQPSIAVGPAPGSRNQQFWIVSTDFVTGNIRAVTRGATITGRGQIGGWTSNFFLPGSANGAWGDIAIGPRGEVVTYYQHVNSGPGPDTLLVNTDPDGVGPLPFGPAVQVTRTNVGGFLSIPSQPRRTIDAKGALAWDRSRGPHRGRLYITYVDSPSVGSADTDIMVRFSDDVGRTWSPAIRVNDDRSGNSQFFPRIAVDQRTGVVAASWYDARFDRGNGDRYDRDGRPNDDVVFFGSVSFSGGGSWLPNVELSPLPSEGIATPNPNEYGDYTGLAFAGDVFHPAWADNSLSLNPPAPDLPNLEIATVAVRVPRITALRDVFEKNETSDRASIMGTLSKGQSQMLANLTIGTQPNGLPDYDWFRWRAGSNGIFQVNFGVQATSGALELHVFTVTPDNILVELSSLTTGQDTTFNQGIALTGVRAGTPILLEVKGKNSSLGVLDSGIYDMIVQMG